MRIFLYLTIFFAIILYVGESFVPKFAASNLSLKTDSTKGSISYAEREYDDQLIRNGVGGQFNLIEGAFAALVMVFSLFFALTFAIFRKWKISATFLLLSILSFVFRVIKVYYFSLSYLP